MKSWTVDDVMTEAVVAVDEAATYRSVVDELVGHRFSAVPVVDDFHRVVGVVSEADLVRKIEYAGDETPRLFEGRRRRGERGKARARTVAELMSAPAVTAVTGTSIAAAARLMDREGVKRLPVVDELGRLVGVVTRGDLLKVHLRPDEDLRADVRAVAAAGPGGRVEVGVAGGVVTVDGRVEQASTAVRIVRDARRIPGVVDVVDKISFAFDDVDAPGIAYGIG